MRLDLLNSVDAQPFILVRDQPLNQINRSGAQVCLGGYDQRLAPVQDLLAGDLGVLRKEGGVAYQHLLEDHAHGPPVGSLGLALLAEDLGSDLVGGAHGRKDQLAVALVVLLADLGEVREQGLGLVHVDLFAEVDFGADLLR